MRTVKRTALVFAACLMAAASAAAQNVTAGVKGGFVLNSTPNAGQVIDQITLIESVDVTARFGLTGGGYVQFAFNDQFSLQPEMLFVMKGVAPPEITMRQVWAAAFPYTVIVFGVLMLVVFVPSVATLLTGAAR